MTANESRSETVSAEVTLGGADWKIRTKVSVPAGPMQPVELLPLIQSFTDGVVSSAQQAVQQAGHRVSCKMGCGACCRHLVPISQLEAQHLRDLVDAMPESRRTELLRRFQEAREKLDRAGLLDRLRHPERDTEQVCKTDQVVTQVCEALYADYFRLRIACPFLEEESCSIYEDRPVTCRQYLVTSPAENCAQPSAEIHSVELPLRPLEGLLRFGGSPGAPPAWVPLILALEWAHAHPLAQPSRPGPELLREFFGRLIEREPQEHAATGS